MRLIANTNFNHLNKIISHHFSSDNILSLTKVDENVYFILLERFYFRNGTRTSLSIVAVEKEDQLIMEIVASGGGKGLVFKMDFGSSSSFEREILDLLSRKNIKYEIIR